MSASSISPLNSMGISLVSHSRNLASGRIFSGKIYLFPYVLDF